MKRNLPWDALMAAGLGRLGMAPEAFWAMSPRELGAALGVRPGEGALVPLDREGLAVLMARHPDKTEHGR